MMSISFEHTLYLIFIIFLPQILMNSSDFDEYMIMSLDKENLIEIFI
jgi:hypothetical protein